MPSIPNSPDNDYAECIRKRLHDSPESALALLPAIKCSTMRNQQAALIARCWARIDINIAWNAVARSTLNAAEKQLMFNELWG